MSHLSCIKFGAKLLLLNEERSIINLFKTSNDREGFHYNLNSLAEMSRWMNVELLRSLTGIADSQKGSVQLIKEFTKQKGRPDLQITEYLKQLGNLRQGFPAHEDHERVIQAHDFFQFRYPIPEKDFASTNIKLLELYNAALKELFDFVISPPKQYYK